MLDATPSYQLNVTGSMKAWVEHQATVMEAEMLMAVALCAAGSGVGVEEVKSAVALAAYWRGVANSLGVPSTTRGEDG